MIIPTNCNFRSAPVLDRYTSKLIISHSKISKWLLGGFLKKEKKTRPFDFGHNESTVRERSENNKPPRLAIGFTGSCSSSLGVSGTLLPPMKFVSLYGRVNRSRPSNHPTPVGGRTRGDGATNVRRKRFRGEHSTRRRAIGRWRDLKKPRSSRFFSLFRDEGRVGKKPLLVTPTCITRFCRVFRFIHVSLTRASRTRRHGRFRIPAHVPALAHLPGQRQWYSYAPHTPVCVHENRHNIIVLAAAASHSLPPTIT